MSKLSKFTIQIVVVAMVSAAAFTVAQAQPAPGIDQPLAEVDTGSRVYKLAWNPDGQTLAAATADGLVLYDPDLQVVEQLHTGTIVYSVSWHPDGTQLAVTNGSNLEIWRWDGSALSLFTTLQGDNSQINVLWSPDGTRIASVEGLDLEHTAWNGTIKFWNAATGSLTAATERKYEFLKDFATVNQIAWEPNGAPQLIMVGNTLYIENGEYFIETTAQIRFIDAETAAQIRVIPLVVNWLVTAVTWHPSGATIGVGAPSGMGLYDTATGEYIGPLNTDSEAAVAEWSPDGRYVIGNSRVYDTVEDKTLGYFTNPPLAGVVAVTWFPDGSKITTANTDGRIKIDDATLLPGFQLSPNPRPED